MTSFSVASSSGYFIKFAINGSSAYPSLYHFEIICIKLSSNAMSKNDIFVNVSEVNVPVYFEIFCLDLVPGSSVEASLYLVDSDFLLGSIITKTSQFYSTIVEIFITIYFHRAGKSNKRTNNIK